MANSGIRVLASSQQFEQLKQTFLKLTPTITTWMLQVILSHIYYFDKIVIFKMFILRKDESEITCVVSFKSNFVACLLFWQNCYI